MTNYELRHILLPLLLGERVCQDIILQPNKKSEKSDIVREPTNNGRDGVNNEDTEDDEIGDNLGVDDDDDDDDDDKEKEDGNDNKDDGNDNSSSD